MSSLQYLNKRDSSGLLLKNLAYGLSQDISEECLNIVSSYRLYKELEDVFSEKYTEMYFKKMFFFEFLPIAHQITIYDWETEKTGKNDACQVDVSSFSCLPLLELVWPNSSIKYSKKIDFSRFIKNHKNIVKSIYRKVLTWKNLIKNILSSIGRQDNLLFCHATNIIAVCNGEGVDMNKRSDLFWLSGSGVQASSVLVYFENDTNVDAQTRQLDSYGVKWIKLWEWEGLQSIEFIDCLYKYVRNNRPVDPIEKWFHSVATTLINEVRVWYSFFKQFNVKIHHDHHEYGLTATSKQIALKKLSGCSIGKMRSYPDNQKGKFYHYFPNDIFFVWGKDSANRLSNKISNCTENKIDSIVISGFPYDPKMRKSEKLLCIQDNLKRNGVKYTVLLLDSNHCHNTDWCRQSIETRVLEEFYNAFLLWLIKGEENGLIIKPKKMVFFNSLPGIRRLLQVATSTGRLHIVKDPLQVIPSEYAVIAEMVVAITSEDLPSALIESIAKGVSGMFFDYARLRSVERDLYSWGENKVVFTDLTKMIVAIDAYKNCVSANLALGDWSNHLDELDPFRDGHGGERVGTYIRWLQEGYNEELECEDNINRANARYAKAWGNDKIFISEQPI